MKRLCRGVLPWLKEPDLYFLATLKPSLRGAARPQLRNEKHLIPFGKKIFDRGQYRQPP
jgi:hypothetical protein